MKSKWLSWRRISKRSRFMTAGEKLQIYLLHYQLCWCVAYYSITNTDHTLSACTVYCICYYKKCTFSLQVKKNHMTDVHKCAFILGRIVGYEHLTFLSDWLTVKTYSPVFHQLGLPEPKWILIKNEIKLICLLSQLIQRSWMRMLKNILLIVPFL